MATNFSAASDQPDYYQISALHGKFIFISYHLDDCSAAISRTVYKSRWIFLLCKKVKANG
jgi:hypothetical protein